MVGPQPDPHFNRPPVRLGSNAAELFCAGMQDVCGYAMSSPDIAVVHVGEDVVEQHLGSWVTRDRNTSSPLSAQVSLVVPGTTAANLDSPVCQDRGVGGVAPRKPRFAVAPLADCWVSSILAHAIVDEDTMPLNFAYRASE